MPKERNKADDYREKAYAGDTKAMNNLGVCYERGTGVKVNLEMAFDWYMKAAQLDDVYGCFNVGECYYHGKGVEPDPVLAFEWYMKAADKGDMQSQVNVANAYYLGNGIEMDHHKAYPRTFPHAPKNTKKGKKVLLFSFIYSRIYYFCIKKQA